MVLSLSNLKPNQKKKKKKRIGRGDASGHGTYAGRGQKGQKARAGGKKGMKIKALRRVWKKIPKRGGFKSKTKKIKIFNLENLEKIFSSTEEIKPETLLAKGLIKNKKERFKILGKKLNKKLKISAYAFSKSAENAIKKIGGTIELIR